MAQLPARAILAMFVLLLVSLAGTPMRPEKAHAAFPGGNGKIVYQDGTSIRVLQADGAGGTTLGPGFDPQWSPDGTRIAFYDQDASFHFDVKVMNEDGSGVANLTNTAGLHEFNPGWSPDGMRVTFVRGTDLAGYELWVMNADGSGQQQITDPGLGLTLNRSVTIPRWSPDGSRILFGARMGATEDLFTITPTGGSLTNVTNTEHSGGSAYVEAQGEWSPDGSQIVFSGSEPIGLDDPFRIYLMKADGSGRVPLTSGSNDFSPAFSPDGEMLLFSRINLDLMTRELVVMKSDGSGQAVIVQGAVFGGDWQPKVLLHSVEFTQAIQQWQTIAELKADLEPDGEPPVPIVDGKPAAMRVYFSNVPASAAYTVEVSGVVNRTETVTLHPGCTPAKRRKQESACQSVDFFFTPPQGAWSVTLEVKDSGGDVVEEHTFNLTSRDADDVVIRAVSVCDSKQPGLFGMWDCQDPASAFQLAALTRRTFPASSVTVQLTASIARRETAGLSEINRWWQWVNDDLRAMYTLSDAISGLAGVEVLYYGTTRPEVPGSTLGMSYRGSRAGAGKATWMMSGHDVAPWVAAHELGHSVRLKHTATSAPSHAGSRGCWPSLTSAPTWPYADNALRSGPAPGTVEVGYDVASKVAIPGDRYFELMGYCTAPPPSTAAGDVTSWISPFSTLEMLGPGGPLSSALLEANFARTEADFWLVGGTLDADAGGVDFRPLFTLTTEGPVGPSSGSHRLEVREAGGSVLMTRFLTPAGGHGTPPPGEDGGESPPAFSELIPVIDTATSIVLLEDDAELGRIELGGIAPTVEIVLPPGTSGVQPLAWNITDLDSDAHTSWVDYSADGGQSWHNLGMSLGEPGLAVDFDLLAGSSNGIFRVIASDGVNSGTAISDPISVPSKLPHAAIVAPTRRSFRTGDLVWLQAAAWDVDDGSLDGSAVAWSSSLGGPLGTGSSLPTYDLDPGTHTITLTATDTDGNIATDSVVVTVTAGSIVEGARIWGDSDCSGAVDANDIVEVLRGLAGYETGGPGCEPVTIIVPIDAVERLWGDVDCNGAFELRDALYSLRRLAELEPASPQGCPEIGQLVNVLPL